MKMKKTISFALLLILGATSVSYASIDKNLKYGQRDKEVTELQEFLIDGGFLNGTPTTFFGLLTLKAVKIYQKSVSISPTGYVGVLTRQKINDTIASDLASSTQAEIQETGTTTTNTYKDKQSTVVASTTKVTSIDYCKNIEGVQTKVPDGMFLDNNGVCFTPVVNQPNTTQTTNNQTQTSNQNNTQTQTQTVTTTSKGSMIICQCSGSPAYVTQISDTLLNNLFSLGSTITLGAMVTDASGNNVGDSTMTITTSDPSQNTTINGSKSYVQNPSNYPSDYPVTKKYYPFVYHIIDGNNTITFSASGISSSITLKGYTPTPAGTLLDPVLSSSSAVPQFVVGGSNFGLATFRFKSTKGSVGVGELHFTSNNRDAIESITVNNNTYTMVGGAVTIPNLGVGAGETGIDIPVTVKLAGFQNSISGGNLTSSTGPVYITLDSMKDGNGNITHPSVSTNPIYVVASKPTITVGFGANSPAIVLGNESKIGEFTISADANGKIAVQSMSLDVTPTGIQSPEITSARVTDGATTITGSSVTGSSVLQVSFSPKYEIPAGTSKTISVYATVKGTVNSGDTPRVSTRLSMPASSFVWSDSVGGDTTQTGAYMYNFPTNSFTTQ